MLENETLVEIRGVTKRFDGVAAVDQASLDLGKGQFLTILGPSGCGKTTLLRMIAGFSEPDGGEILIGGQRVENVPPHKRSIGMVFQKLALFPHMTAAENVAYPLKMRRFDPKSIPDRVARYLDLVRLADYGRRRPHELSGGQQQRVAIARALSFGPDLLLLDEPLSALDKKLREEMQLEFRRIQQELGVTTINVTHDQREALVMSDRVVVMNAGRIQQSAAPETLYRDPANPFVASFMGMTSMISGIAQGLIEPPNGAPQAASQSVRVGDHELRARLGPAPIPAGEAVDCAIRAEQIRILGAGEDGCDNVLDATVESRIFEGDRMVYAVRVAALSDARLYLFDHDPLHHQVHEIESSIRIGWNAKDLFPFPTTRP